METARTLKSKEKSKGGAYYCMKYYFEFKGVKYGIGTIVKVPSTLELRWRPRDEIMETARFGGNSCFEFMHKQGAIKLYESSGHLSGKYEDYIEIIEPIYYQEPEPPEPQNIFFRTKSGSWDAYNEVCVGFIWYVAVMLVATIFKDRVGIWTIATIIYFLWKSQK